jgi:hypothetical protein
MRWNIPKLYIVKMFEQRPVERTYRLWIGKINRGGIARGTHNKSRQLRAGSESAQQSHSAPWCRLRRCKRPDDRVALCTP